MSSPDKGKKAVKKKEEAKPAGQDIRRFFATKPGGAAKPPTKPASTASAQDAPKPAAPAAAPKPEPAKAPVDASPSPASKGRATPKRAAAAAGAAAGRKRAKAIVIDSNSDEAYEESEQESGGDDSDFEMEDLADEAEAEADAEGGGKRPAAAKPPRKAAKPSPGATPGGRSGAAKGGGGGKKGAAAERPKVVVTPHAKPAAKQEAAEEEGADAAAGGGGAAAGGKRKLPGSVAAAVAEPVKAPKRAAVKKEAPSGDAADAIRLAEDAAAALPEIEEEGIEWFVEGMAFDDNPTPPMAGQKEVPRGHDECLKDKAFVFSGHLPSLTREQARDLVCRHGGRVTGDVSGKTAFLVIGQLASKRKFKQAHEKAAEAVAKAAEKAAKGGKAKKGTPERPPPPCKVIDEDGLFAIIAATSHMADGGQPPQPPSQQPKQQPKQEVKQEPAASPEPAAAAAASGPAPLRGAAFHGSGSGGGSGAGYGAAPSPAQAPYGSGPAGSQRPPGVPSSQLWVDKYKPVTSADLVGNQGAIQTLRQWLAQWEAIHLRGAQPAAQKGPGKPKDLTKKAVLLAGPPGIGKTSAAHIIAKELGYRVVEVNASDTRNKADAQAGAGIAGKASNRIREMVTSTSLLGLGGPKVRQLLVMDEVDGMSGGDRGGVQDLIVTIKASKVPIICIANDKYAQKLKSLKNHTLELDFRRPPADQIAKRMAQIASKEGMQVQDAAMRELAAQANQDLRLVLGQMQMMRLSRGSIRYDDVKAGARGASKDADMSPFDAARKLLEGTNPPANLAEQLDFVFADADLVPLLVQENYVNYMPNIAHNVGMRLRVLAKAADCISAGDAFNRRVRGNAQWALMPAAGLVGTVMPAVYMRGRRESMYDNDWFRFTAVLGNMSTSNKQRRLLADLSANLAASGHVQAGRGAVRMMYVPALKELITRPLLREGDSGIEAAVDVMREYCITRDQLDFMHDVTKWKTPSWTDEWKEVPPKTKAAFTRAFNKQGLVPKTNTMVEPPKKKGRGRSGARGGGGGGGGGGASDDDDAEEERVAPDAEDGAALEEQGGRQRAPSPGGAPGGSGGGGGDGDEDEDEDEDDEAVVRRLKGQGVKVELREPAAKGKSGGGGGGGSGRGGGRSGGGRGRSGGGGSGGGRGRGRK